MMMMMIYSLLAVLVHLSLISAKPAGILPTGQQPLQLSSTPGFSFANFAAGASGGGAGNGGAGNIQFINGANLQSALASLSGSNGAGGNGGGQFSLANLNGAGGNNGFSLVNLPAGSNALSLNQLLQGGSAGSISFSGGAGGPSAPLTITAAQLSQLTGKPIEGANAPASPQLIRNVYAERTFVKPGREILYKVRTPPKVEKKIAVVGQYVSVPQPPRYAVISIPQAAKIQFVPANGGQAPGTGAATVTATKPSSNGAVHIHTPAPAPAPAPETVSGNTISLGTSEATSEHSRPAGTTEAEHDTGAVDGDHAEDHASQDESGAVEGATHEESHHEEAHHEEAHHEEGTTEAAAAEHHTANGQSHSNGFSHANGHSQSNGHSQTASGHSHVSSHGSYSQERQPLPNYGTKS